MRTTFLIAIGSLLFASSLVESKINPNENIKHIETNGAADSAPNTLLKGTCGEKSCFHRGKCVAVDNDSSYYCECKRKYFGPHCEKKYLGKKRFQKNGKDHKSCKINKNRKSRRYAVVVSCDESSTISQPKLTKDVNNKAVRNRKTFVKGLKHTTILIKNNIVATSV